MLGSKELLYEAAFNANNKTLGREMMYYAEQLNVIEKEQYGSRWGHCSVDQVLNRGITSDIVRQMKIPAAICSNDAKSCYDRIVHSMASLSMQHVKVPPGPKICMFSTIQSLNHYIRTIYGDSDLSFTGALWTVPIQGVGQGNGAGPQIWALVSTLVLNLLRAKGYKAFFKAALSGMEIHFVGYGFADDVDLIVTAKDPMDDFKTVLNQMQGSLDTWAGGIRVTGGGLVPSKSCWTLIDFIWKQGNASYDTLEQCPGEIYMDDIYGERHKLNRLAPDETERALGVRLAADGNCKAELAFLKSRVNQWADSIRTGCLPRHLAWQSMTTTILKSIQYPLPATTLSHVECQLIMKPLLKVGLSATGVMSTIA